jgi:hypothetical protein
MRRTVGRNGLHLAVLWTFAVSQPLFDLLGKTPEFFVVRDSTATDIVVFAVVLALVPPALFVLIEALVALAGSRALQVLHLVLVAGLASVVAVQIVRKHSHSTALVLAVAAALGVAFAALYARSRAVPLFLTVLAPVTVIFLALFLARSPIEKLEGTAKALSIEQPRHDPTVVLVVFDEFPIASLMNAQHRINAGRYPNFAALARTSTWYRNATSVHEHTTEAVPAILTGQNPKQGALPLAKDHPDSVFTLLASRYREDAYESVTQLCPTSICPRRRESFASRMRSLADDLEVVYGHLILPRRLEDRLPSVSETWQGFGGKNHGGTDSLSRNPLLIRDTKQVDGEVGAEMWRDQRSIWDVWTNGIEHSSKPSLDMIHLLMPHYPWRYLPNGKQYGNSLGIDGLRNDSWSTDRWIVEQGWQRHLLQVGFTDRLLGSLMARLKLEGIWDRALIVVVADHGVSFIPGEHRRSVDRANLPDIASIPLFVKYPSQRRGVISDKSAESIDVVPTIADVLGLRLPYHVDGISLRSRRAHGEVDVREREGGQVTGSARRVHAAKYATLRRQLALFGSGSWAGVYAVGPHRELLGRAAPARAPLSKASVSIDGGSLFRHVDLRSQLSPGHITGVVSMGRLDLAVAVNGRIAAVTSTFDVDGDQHFSAFVPDSDFRDGANRVEVYAVRGGRLEQLHGGIAGATWTLRQGRLYRGGQLVPVRPGALGGKVEDWFNESETVRFGGWAADGTHGRLVDEVLVFRGGRLIYAGTTTVGRRDIPFKGAGGNAVRLGFVFDLPRSAIGDGPLRFFGIRGNVASELRYARNLPWRPPTAVSG